MLVVADRSAGRHVTGLVEHVGWSESDRFAGRAAHLRTDAVTELTPTPAS